jgi:hypothetical protein
MLFQEEADVQTWLIRRLGKSSAVPALPFENIQSVGESLTG